QTGGGRGPRRQAPQRLDVERVPGGRARIEPVKERAADAVKLDLVAGPVRLNRRRGDASRSEFRAAGLERLERLDPLHVPADRGVDVAAFEPEAGIVAAATIATAPTLKGCCRWRVSPRDEWHLQRD